MGFDKFQRPIVPYSGSPIYKFWFHTLAATPVGASATPTVAEETFTIVGLDATYDKVLQINTPAMGAGYGVAGARISANSTIAISFVCAGGTGSPTAGNYEVVIVRTKP